MRRTANIAAFYLLLVSACGEDIVDQALETTVSTHRAHPLGGYESINFSQSGNFVFFVSPPDVLTQGYSHYRKGQFDSTETARLASFFTYSESIEQQLHGCQALDLYNPPSANELMDMECLKRGQVILEAQAYNSRDFCVARPEQLIHCSPQVQALASEGVRLLEQISITTPPLDKVSHSVDQLP